MLLKSKVERIDLDTLPSPLQLKKKILLKVNIPQTILTTSVNTSLLQETSHSKESLL